jgi:hypothetical protein
VSPHFGLHVDDDLVFLHQQDGGVCLTPGLSELESPYEAPPPKVKCPHAIKPAPGPLPPLNPLIDALSPVPDGGAYWARPELLPIIRDAYQMSWPTSVSSYLPIWANPLAGLVSHLSVTNLTPLILIGYEPRHLRRIIQLLELPRIRTILFCGPMKPPGTVEVTTDPITETIDWRAAGAAVLHQHVQTIIEQAKS